MNGPPDTAAPLQPADEDRLYALCTGPVSSLDTSAPAVGWTNSRIYWNAATDGLRGIHHARQLITGAVEVLKSEKSTALCPEIDGCRMTRARGAWEHPARAQF